MALFGRKTQPSVMPKSGGKEPADVAARPPRKERIMAKPADGKDTLLQDAAPKRRTFGGEVSTSAAPARGAGGGGETILSPDALFDGKIVAQGELRIDGNFRGEIISSGCVVVGTAGKIDATIEEATGDS